MTMEEAISIMDVLVESGDDREREAWVFIRDFLAAVENTLYPLDMISRRSQRLDRVAWGDGNAEQDE